MVGIRLRSVKYRELQGKERAWSLDELALGSINLLVGKNATGKTRVITIIDNLANCFLREGNLAFHEGGYDVEFTDGETITRYELVVEDGKVKRERLTVNSDEKLVRDSRLMKIWADELGQRISMHPSDTQIAAVARRDDLQHPFLNPLHDWANTVRVYHFGARLGKDSFCLTVDNSAGNVVSNLQKQNDRDEDAIVATYRKARIEFGERYDQAVISDMNSLGYRLSAVDVSPPVGMKFATNVPVQGVINAIAIQEEGVEGWIHQHSISQGMFRTFSIIAQVNYSLMSNRASCILIDDIGEGLDFERSTKLVELLRVKASKSDFQLIMTTNDQFVMNHVPLDEWSVLHRDGSRISVRNIENSRPQFEEFKFIGLTNFSFFELDYLNAGSGTLEAVAHE